MIALSLSKTLDGPAGQSQELNAEAFVHEDSFFKKRRDVMAPNKRKERAIENVSSFFLIRNRILFK